jgi:transposase
MNDLVDTNIVELYHPRYTHDEITATLHTSKTRVSRSIRHFHETGLIPDALCVGRPSKVTSELASYIEARTIQEQSISGESLSGEISHEFNILRTAADLIRVGQRFKYQPKAGPEERRPNKKSQVSSCQKETG